MKITRLEDCPETSVDMEGVKGAYKKIPLGTSDGVPNFSIRVFRLEPGGHTPHHTHESEHLNYVLEGRGEIMTDDGPRSISAGDYILVKPFERHQYKNPASEPLVFMCMVPKRYE